MRLGQSDPALRWDPVLGCGSTHSKIMHKNAAALLFCIVAVTPFADVMTAQTPLDPEKAVTLADVQTLLNGKFAARIVEPGLVKYEEVGSLWPDIDEPFTLAVHARPIESVISVDPR